MRICDICRKEHSLQWGCNRLDLVDRIRALEKELEELSPSDGPGRAGTNE